MRKAVRTFEAPSGVLIIAALVLAPFLGGKEELMGTAGVAVLILIAALALLWSRQFARPAGLGPLAIFVGLLALSAVVTASLHATIQQAMYFAACAAAGLTASSVGRGRKWFTAALFALAAAGLVLGLLAVREYRDSGAGWRVFATFVNPSYFGGWLVLVLPVTLSVFLAARSPVLLGAAGIAWGLELAALLLTGTRFAIVSALAAFLVLGASAVWARSLGRRQLAWLGVAAAIAVIALATAFVPTAARTGGRAAVEQAHSLQHRIATWHGTARIIRSHPLLGTGIGTFELVFPRYMVAGYTRNAHDGYMQIAAEAGIPALMALAAALGALILAGLRGLRRDDDTEHPLLQRNGVALLACGALAAVAGSLIRNLLDSDLYNPGIGFAFWILAGLVASCAPHPKPVNPHAALRGFLTVLALGMVVLWSLFVIAGLKAEVAAMESDPGSAIELYRSAISLDPLNADHWLHLGQVKAYTAGDDEDQWRQGVADVRRAARLEPTRARDRIVLGRILAARGDTSGALREFRAALDLDPHSTRAMLSAARLLQGREADAMYRRMLDEEKSPVERLRGVPELVNPDFAWAHYHFGLEDMRSQVWRDAAAHFRAAVERLERRKSYKMYREAAEAAGMVDPAEEQALDQLLSDCKAALKEANLKAGG